MKKLILVVAIIISCASSCRSPETLDDKYNLKSGDRTARSANLEDFQRMKSRFDLASDLKKYDFSILEKSRWTCDLITRNGNEFVYFYDSIFQFHGKQDDAKVRFIGLDSKLLYDDKLGYYSMTRPDNSDLKISDLTKGSKVSLSHFRIDRSAPLDQYGRVLIESSKSELSDESTNLSSRFANQRNLNSPVHLIVHSYSICKKSN